MSESYFQETVNSPVTAEEITLRPPGFEDFHGQEKVTDRLMLMVEAAKQREDVLEHVLLSGPPGLGKTTLANIVATAVGSTLHTTSGPQIEKAGDLAGVLTNLQRGDVLFIDEIHRLHPAIEEYLYPAMEDYRLDIIIDSGPSARSIQLQLPKFTLIVATAVGSTLHTTSGPQIEKAGDLAGVLTNLQRGDVLFIDEIHRLHPAIEEYLYPAMEDYRLDIIIDSGPSARSIQLQLPKFTLVGATTRSGMLTSPLRSRFGLINRLDYYTQEQLAFIITRSASILDLNLNHEGALVIASRSRGTPRIANNLLRWVRDYAQVRSDGKITAEVAEAALVMIEIDEDGLDEMDTRLLEAMIYKFNGGPVGLSSLAVAIGEDASTLEEVHEPFLIMQGFVKRTPRGRVAMPAAYTKIGADLPPDSSGQQSLL